MPYYESFDQTKIYYQFFPGAKPYTLFFLPGWTAQGDFYLNLREFLPDFNLFFWDPRCHGKSEIRQDSGVVDMARDFHFFLNKVYALSHPVIPVGHSMGALTLFEYVKNFKTDQLSKLVIIDQSPKLVTDETWNLGIYGEYTAEQNEKMVELFLKDLGDGLIILNANGLNEDYKKLYQRHPEVLQNKKRHFSHEATTGMTSIWKTLAKADYRKTVEAIDIPTLLLYGLKSQYYVKETGEFLNQKIKNSKLVQFPKGDHAPFAKHPQEFCKAITDFVLENRLDSLPDGKIIE